MSVRLNGITTESGIRTNEVYSRVQAISMSAFEKRANIQQSDSSKRYNQRVEFFSSKGK